MKKTLLSMVAVMVVLSGSQLGATTYSDTVGDLNSSPGDNFTAFTHLDLISAEITNTATDIYFTIGVSQASITSPNNWGNYMIGIDSVAGGDTVGNGWNRPISMNSGMDYWLGSWVNGTPGNRQVWNWTGVSWNQLSQDPVTVSGNTVTFFTSLASLGLSPGNSFTFDIYGSGSGADSAIDALANPSISVSTWGQTYNSGSTVYSYTVTPVPEPSLIAFFGLGGVVVGGYLFRRKN